jgi:hypothetical protein
MNVNPSRFGAFTPIASEERGSAGFKVDLSRGECFGRVSSEWFSRPNDERFRSLSDLYAAVSSRVERARPEPWRVAAFASRRAATTPIGWL